MKTMNHNEFVRSMFAKLISEKGEEKNFTVNQADPTAATELKCFIGFPEGWDGHERPMVNYPYDDENPESGSYEYWDNRSEIYEVFIQMIWGTEIRITLTGAIGKELPIQLDGYYDGEEFIKRNSEEDDLIGFMEDACLHGYFGREVYDIERVWERMQEPEDGYGSLSDYE